MCRRSRLRASNRGRFMDLVEARVSFDLSGRVCIVTGAGQGIGRAIAISFAAHGAAVIVADLSEIRAVEVAAEITAAGGNARAATLDVADRDAIAELVRSTSAQFGALDVLVHNAAYFPLRPFAAIDAEVLERTLAVNLKAAFWLTQAALPLLRQSKHARVLVTSSVTGPRVAYPGLAHYAASKAGLNGFVRAAALELAPEGITVNGVEPGMIATAASANLGDETHAAEVVRGIPLGRLGRPEDIAHAMLFLASDAATYITGQTLVVDGGALLPECRIAIEGSR
jgi:3-oxoacyl-[acyl-carrier protein] reductase